MKDKIVFFVLATCFVVVLTNPLTSNTNIDADTNTNCTLCQTLYNNVLKNFQPANIDTEAHTKAYIFAECNFFRANQIPIWPFCYQLFNEHFQQVWDALKARTPAFEACSGFKVC
uniref:Saposin B-type domain-containing protein n=1 Tax=Panagrellus redivivus TaxID=6233 RepID=A0A7E4UVP1_PANRE